MVVYFFILGVVALGISVYYLFTKNLHAKRMARIFCLIFLIIFIFLYVFLYFFARGEEKAFLESFNNPEVKRNIEIYLGTHIITANFGGKIFCSYEFLGAFGIEDIEEAYVWALCEEYYLKNNALVQGVGVSLPVVLIFKNDVIIESKKPRDGSLYSQDVKTTFPRVIRRKISSNNFVPELTFENRTRAKLEFKVNQ